MRQFYMIDPWLGDAKGHNLQFALDVAGAAEQAGYRPVLGVLHSLSQEAPFPLGWQVERVFPFGACARHSIGLDGRNPYPCDPDGKWLPDLPGKIPWWRRWVDLLAGYDRRRRIAGFGRGCQQLFERFPPREDDVLMLPSVADFEFLAAVRYWRDHPWTRAFDWHLLFHFNFLEGRDPEFAEQTEPLRRFQRLFRAAVDQIPEHRLHFYGTTAAVARQFDALGIAIFHPLPYPTRKLSHDDQRTLSGSISSRSPVVVESPMDRSVQRRPGEEGWGQGRPLRVTLAGAMRREKGKKRLSALIDSVWDEFLKPGHLQLVLQGSPDQIRQRLPRRLRGIVSVAPAGEESEQDPFVAVPHPLDAARYDELIRQSDIGLLAYDARRYFSRASGVLCEMLSAGVPVLVPAGCWLADQISEENYRHVDGLWRQFGREHKPIGIESGAKVRLSIAARTLLIRFPWPADAEPGVYVELSVRSGSTNRSVVLGPRESDPVGAVLRFTEPVRELQVTARAAFDVGDGSVPSLQLLALPERDLAPPLARVGLIFAEDGQIPELLAELVRCYPHYRRTAGDFAPLWQLQHSPEVTVSRLRSRTRSSGTRDSRAA
jgi:hypothetical protein